MAGIRFPLWVLVSGILLQGCDSSPNKQAEVPKQKVGIITVVAETIESSHQLSGRTVASETSQVRPQVNGVVTAQLFKEGTFVQANQPLYQIDPALYQASVNQAAANLALSKASLKFTRQQAQRYTELFKVDGISKADLENAQSAYDQAKASVGANEAALATAKTNLRYSRVVAPISGQIGRSSITRGALVTASQESALATIQKLDPMYVDMTQSSEEYLSLRKALTDANIDPSSLTVQLQSKDGTLYPQTGKLAFSDIAVDEATGSVTLRASFPNPEQSLLPGMYVRAKLSAAPRKDALMIPQGAVVRNPKGDALVWIVDAKNNAEQRAVTLGSAIGNRWQVLSGLSPKDRVIIKGLQGLRTGIPVVIEP